MKKSILKKVERPGRYLGLEMHSIHKKNVKGRCRVCLAFPDLYEIAMSHLGLQILYGILNAREDVVCERVFAPAIDLEKILRRKRRALTSLESNMPLKRFDIVGFSLQYELGYSNMLTMLDLAKIPVFAAKRKKGPLVIAGGPCSVNPEVVAPFVDAFIIGDGEESLPRLIDAYEAHKKKWGCLKRDVFFKEISLFPGVYVPSLYESNMVNLRNDYSVSPIHNYAPKVVRKTFIRDYADAPYPTKPIIPLVKTVHDRACVEIMRGCPNVCKFCQAREYYYPVRKRTPERVRELAREVIEQTGYDEISLLSLSSGDYPDIESLLDSLMEYCMQQRVSLSFPSIRIEKLISILPKYFSALRKTGLTFAPEAGSVRLREYIGKNINIEYLMSAAADAYKKGYKHVKLYFMIGLPTETYEDLDALVDLVFAVAKSRLQHARKPGYVNVSIGTFIPKPHTAFEREHLCSPDQIREKQEYLRHKLNKGYIKYNFTNVETSIVEAVLARGDRRIAQCLYTAWKKGARFDAWLEHFNYTMWADAFTEQGIDIVSCATRAVSDGDVLPWAHIALR